MELQPTRRFGLSQYESLGKTCANGFDPSPSGVRCAADAVNTSALTACGWCVQAIPGATLVASLTPGLAIHGKSFGPQEALLLVGCADRASPMPRTPAAHRTPDGDSRCGGLLGRLLHPTPPGDDSRCGGSDRTLAAHRTPVSDGTPISLAGRFWLAPRSLRARIEILEFNSEMQWVVPFDLVAGGGGGGFGGADSGDCD